MRTKTYLRILRVPMEFYRILITGAFSHAAYAEKYFKDRRLFFVSLIHYLISGERRGYFPNPFFSPNYFLEKAGTPSFSEYLHDQRLWVHSTSVYFDANWYTFRYSEHIPASQNPLLHFWRTGFDACFDPAPDFDTSFFQRAVARDTSLKKEAAFRVLANPEGDTPLNMGELERRQSEFRNRIKIRELKLASRSSNQFLVFVQAGHEFTAVWLDEQRDFDVLVNYYEPVETIAENIDFAFYQPGTKATAIYKFLEEYKSLILSYEAVLFLDDDVVISKEQIEELFLVRQTQGLDVVQASLSSRSECFFPILKQPIAGNGIRPISATEIMMPLVSKRALEQFAWVFGESVSGWGVDLLLGQKVREVYGNTVALLADIVCEHLRKVDQVGGSFYLYMSSQGIAPSIEMGRIAIKYGVNDKINGVAFLGG
jgi:hypothetical protein